MTQLDKITELIDHYVGVMYEMTGEMPREIHINEDLLREMSHSPEFWNKPQFKTLITSSAPVLNKYHCQSTNHTMTVVPRPTSFEPFFSVRV